MLAILNSAREPKGDCDWKELKLPGTRKSKETGELTSLDALGGGENGEGGD